MDYTKLYSEKLVTVEKALEQIKDNDIIVSGTVGSEAQAFLNNLHTIGDRVNNVQIYHGSLQKPYPYQADPKYRGKFIANAYFSMAASRKSMELGLTYASPAHLHHVITRLIQERGINVYVGACTPMDKHGYVRSSLSVEVEREAFMAADLTIMEVNRNIPVVFGDTEFHISDIDYFIEADNPIPILPERILAEEDIKIGEYVASLVNDGDTIQIGIGAIPDAVAKAFKNKRDLGIHTELLTSSIAELAEQGVITGKYKTLHNRRIVAAFILGSQKLYDFVDNNPGVMLMGCNYVNDPYVIAKNDNMVSINSCIEVDLTGQVCGESIGPRTFSGSGGQNDTAEGAIHAKNGRSIIAVQSTKKNGTVSSIAPMLKEGAVVTLSRNNVDYIVTEYGIAKLKARNIKERALNLIQVAHPKFRDELTEKAKELGYIR